MTRTAPRAPFAALASALALCTTVTAAPAVAQDAATTTTTPTPPPGLRIELNAAAAQETGCKLSFVVQNGYGADATKTVLETVIFDAAGQVNRMTLFDFGTLPQGRTRVRQFVIPGTACEGIGQVLFNGAHSCQVEGQDAGACMSNLRLSTRTDIEVLG
ncbi:hypothetical protein [Pseudooceanicola nitratireducens]|uniref:hypothetical protein n=1 Tax=Pseudooceanicola nitratireducens TaxID=517719 RepID=UPI003340EA42